jgi:hypothetical protein
MTNAASTTAWMALIRVTSRRLSSAIAMFGYLKGAGDQEIRRDQGRPDLLVS